MRIWILYLHLVYKMPLWMFFKNYLNASNLSDVKELIMEPHSNYKSVPTGDLQSRDCDVAKDILRQQSETKVLKDDTYTV